jgi:hypothetical protein
MVINPLRVTNRMQGRQVPGLVCTGITLEYAKSIRIGNLVRIPDIRNHVILKDRLCLRQAGNQAKRSQ